LRAYCLCAFNKKVEFFSNKVDIYAADIDEKKFVMSSTHTRHTLDAAPTETTRAPTWNQISLEECSKHNGKVTVRTIERGIRSGTRRRGPRILPATKWTAGTSDCTGGNLKGHGTRALEERRATTRLTVSVAGNWQGGWRREQTSHVRSQEVCQKTRNR
jgi:hypothetical protein